MYSKSPWTKGIAILSIIGIVLVTAFMCYIICTDEKMSFLWIAVALIALAFLWAIAVAPKGVSVDEEGNITIHLLACKIHIAKEDVVKIVPFPSDRGTIRLIGSGGLFGYMGLFKNTEIGKFTCYATDLEKSFVIYRKNKRPIVVTVADSSIFHK